MDRNATDALSLVPDDPMLYFMRWSTNSLFLKRSERAWEDANRINELLPDSGIAVWVLGSTAFFEADYDYLIDFTGDFDQADPGTKVTVIFYRELALLVKGEFETVLAELNTLDPAIFEEFTGFPAVVVPAGFTTGGLPVGIEFLGAPFTENKLTELAYHYETATGHRKPPASTQPLRRR